MPGQFSNGTQMGPETVFVVGILLLLFVFGLWFNGLVNRLGNKQEGFTSFLVVIGVGATSIGIGALDYFLGWNAFFLCLLAFSASGTPMIYGSIKSYIHARERARKALHDTAKTMAK